MMPNSNMMAYNSNSANGIATSPGLGSGSPGLAGSPRMGQAMFNGPNGAVPGGMNAAAMMEAQIRQQHPQMPPQEVVKMVQDNLRKLQQRSMGPSGIAQSAMNAAAGSSNVGNGPQGQQRPPVGMETSSPQMYAQMLANHHRQQSQGQSANTNGQVQGGT